MNKEKAAAAKALFMEGYNCSQAVVGAWAEDIGLDSETAYKIASGFGGGIGRMREVCGAFTGAVMVLGLKFGNTIGSDRAAKARIMSVFSFLQSVSRKSLALTLSSAVSFSV